MVEIKTVEEESVFKRNPKIALWKFVKGLGYSVAVAGITFAIGFIPTVEFPPEYALMAGVAIAALQALKKGLESYDPVKDR